MKRNVLLVSLLLLSTLFSSCSSNKDKNSSLSNEISSNSQLNAEFEVDRHGYDVLSWSDEFDGTSLNMDNWEYQYGTGSQYGLDGWGNQEAQYYQEDNVEIKDGQLVISAIKERVGNKDYTSARIRTAGKVKTTYGRIEALISLPEVEGMWPAFWMLPEETTPYGGWAASGEIDIMEARGRVSDMTSCALHYGVVQQDVYKSATHVIRDKEESIAKDHVYAVEWEKEEFRFYVDDDEVMKVKKGIWFSKTDMENEDAPFDVDFHIILNLAVGGHFDGYRLPPEDFEECQMKVSYVRIYQQGGTHEA